jgi:hypothetical protein
MPRFLKTQEQIMDYLRENPSEYLTRQKAAELFHVAETTAWYSLKELYFTGRLERDQLLVPGPDGIMDRRRVQDVYYLRGYVLREVMGDMAAVRA